MKRRLIDFAVSLDDLAFFKVGVPLNMLQFGTASGTLCPVFPVISLLFFKPSGRHSAGQLVANVSDILEGKMGADGTVQILTMVDEVDIHHRVVRWRMARRRSLKMKEEGWMMTPYRFDAREPGKQYNDLSPVCYLLM